MKRRFIIALTILIVLVFAYTTSRIVFSPKYYGLIDILSLSVIIFDIIYFWFGVPRLIVYFIYGSFMIPSLFFFPEKYHILLIFIYTIVIVVNPLASLEQFLIKSLEDNYTEVFNYTPQGRYKTYYKYKEEMKSHYHLPQTQKFYTNKYYRLISTLSILILFFSLVFLLLFSSSDIVIGAGWQPRSFLTFYMAVLFTIALLVLYKKGFSSTSRVFKIGMFPPAIVALSLIDFNILAKIISIVGLSIGFVVVIISEIIKYYSRVVYSNYNYFDPNTNETVWANALYEPFVYSKQEKYGKLIEFKLPEDLFHKHFKLFLIQTHYHKTIITAYTAKRGIINLYLEYYRKKDIKMVKKHLQKIFDVEIIKSIIVDDAHYEEKFLHNHAYIIAKAKSLSNLLIELKINDPVIISVFMKFKKIIDAKPLANKYETKLLETESDYILIESSIKVENLDYLIETHLRNLLLDMLINGGEFVKVMVYY